MTHAHIALLLAAGLAAGFINAIAGGGTILTFPALLAVGVDSVRANATSTLALIVGIFGSVYGYRGHIAEVRRWLVDFTPVSIVGGLLGGLLLTRTPVSLFDKLVPLLLLFATVLFLVQGFVAPKKGQSDAPGAPDWRAHLVQFLIALYGGYFGAGIGILMLATLGFGGLRDLNHMNTVKTVLGGLINVVAAAYFVWKGLIDWPRMGLVAAGAVPGYYAGSVFSQRIPAKAARAIVVAIGFCITGMLVFKKWL